MFSCTNDSPSIFEKCSGIGDLDGVNNYFNQIDEAFLCATENNKPILIHFTNWGRSNSNFEDKVLINKKVQWYLKTEVLLLSLTNDDKAKIALGEYSKVLESLGFEETTTVGEANRSLKAYLMPSNPNIAEPLYVLVDTKFNIFSHWGYSSNPMKFVYEMKKVSK